MNKKAKDYIYDLNPKTLAPALLEDRIKKYEGGDLGYMANSIKIKMRKDVFDKKQKQIMKLKAQTEREEKKHKE